MVGRAITRNNALIWGTDTTSPVSRSRIVSVHRLQCGKIVSRINLFAALSLSKSDGGKGVVSRSYAGEHLRPSFGLDCSNSPGAGGGPSNLPGSRKTRDPSTGSGQSGAPGWFTQLPAPLPLVLPAEALTGQLRSQGLRSHQQSSGGRRDSTVPQFKRPSQRHGKCSPTTNNHRAMLRRSPCGYE